MQSVLQLFFFFLLFIWFCSGVLCTSCRRGGQGTRTYKVSGDLGWGLGSWFLQLIWGRTVWPGLPFPGCLPATPAVLTSPSLLGVFPPRKGKDWSIGWPWEKPPVCLLFILPGSPALLCPLLIFSFFPWCSFAFLLPPHCPPCMSFESSTIPGALGS